MYTFFKSSVYILLVHRAFSIRDMGCYFEPSASSSSSSSLSLFYSFKFALHFAPLSPTQLNQVHFVWINTKLEQRKKSTNLSIWNWLKCFSSISSTPRVHHSLPSISSYTSLYYRHISNRIRPKPLKKEKKIIRTAFNFLISRRLFSNTILAKIHLKVLCFECLCVR